MGFDEDTGSVAR